MQWLQDPNSNTVNNLNNARPEVNRHFRNNKKERLRAKIYELETKSMIKKTPETCTGATMTLRGVTSLELI